MFVEMDLFAEINLLVELKLSVEIKLFVEMTDWYWHSIVSLPVLSISIKYI